jgi:(E)-4-hydroxy-3-methylbut-2-enyl-diphosphate synthase
VADIHFDYRLALAAIEAGVAKIRINPGNIGGEDRVRAVAEAAGGAGIPIRIGINGGSLEKDLHEGHGGATAKALAESALRNIGLLHRMGFYDLVVSVKSSDVAVNFEAHRLLAEQMDHPLHIGITEAGIGQAALVKSAVGIGSLLTAGIGDTIRVSLTGNPMPEIAAARDILRSTDLLPGAVNLVSCPTCGRCRVDLAQIAGEIAAALVPIEAQRIREAKETGLPKPLTVAVMGCAVNGPGEAAHADVGVAFGDGKAVFFKQGVQTAAVLAGDVMPILLNGINSL